MYEKKVPAGEILYEVFSGFLKKSSNGTRGAFSGFG
jgi:hypothetical protein